MSDLLEILYCSTMASDQEPSVVARIVQHARQHNTQMGITGLLIFDGQHFCQHLEGPPEAVLSLMKAIAGDKRHTSCTVVHQAPLAQRRHSQFAMGYSLNDDDCDPSEVQSVACLSGSAAMARFVELLPRFDIGG